MKKNITINLYGTLYAIDEDACQLLEQYLNNMRNYFSQRDGGEEIADDIEHRVAELLSELRASGQEAVSIDNVQDIIRRIGNPEQMDDEAADPDTESTGQTPPPYHGNDDTTYQSANTGGEKKSWFAGRKLYRDPQDQLLGGVMSGVCQYFGGNDPLPWRILMVILALFSFSTIGIIYLVAWAVIPAARTAEERLQMRGDPVNAQTLSDELMRAAHAATDAVNSPQVQQKARSLGGTLVSIIVFCAKVLAIFLLGSILVSIFCVLCVVIAGCFESLHTDGLDYDSLGSIFNENPLIGWTSILALLSSMVAVGIPFVMLVRSLIKSPERTTSLSTRTRATLLLIFVLSLVCSGVSTIFTCLEIQRAKEVLRVEYAKKHPHEDDDVVISDGTYDDEPIIDTVYDANPVAAAAAIASDTKPKQSTDKAARVAKEKAKRAVKEAKDVAKKAVKEAKKQAEKAAKAEVDAAITSAVGNTDAEKKD